MRDDSFFFFCVRVKAIKWKPPQQAVNRARKKGQYIKEKGSRSSEEEEEEEEDRASREMGLWSSIPIQSFQYLSLPCGSAYGMERLRREGEKKAKWM
ncbi:hypothetical protein E2C01_081783 [Portunus trituberculatus]|uniref:Uncharacterized protein n=1 Tax=Portunus trituberculatus TaxID=210409 RepID=A0A5B7IQP1_PORTR|nr:hypothetical protein [Portunus trituberculatus]